MDTQLALVSTPEPLLSDPQALVEAVQADLRGRVTVEQIALLRAHPAAALGVVRTIEQEIEAQLHARKQEIDHQVAQAPENWNQQLQKYRSWLRQTHHYLKLLRARRRDLERMAPEGLYLQLLREGVLLDADGLRAWQEKVGYALR